MTRTVKDIVAHFREELNEICSPHEAFQFAWLIFEHLRGWSKTQMMLHDHAKLSLSEHLFIQKALERLKNHEPIQYVIGETEFFGLPLEVNASVLVPRPETEELVEWILKDTDSLDAPKILDMGTGSGCIAIALAKFLPGAKVSGSDISVEALRIASANASRNEVKVHFIQSDILNTTAREDENHDIIVSNPPYVRNSEKELMLPNVLNFEPHQALFVDDKDPLLFYREITQFANKTLVKGGRLYLEINRDFGNETKNLLTASGFINIEMRKDLSGNNRMIKAVKPLR